VSRLKNIKDLIHISNQRFVVIIQGLKNCISIFKDTIG